jgi:hypothetical protein
MSESDLESRIVARPSTGARLCLLVAALFIVAAAYALLAPIQVSASNGHQFDCGTAMNGPKSSFAQGICGSANDLSSARATALGVAALVTAVGGLLVFGFDRSEQSAKGVRRPSRREPADDPARS